MEDPVTEGGCSTGVCRGACCAVFPLHQGFAMFNPRMGTASLSAENTQIAQMIVPLTQDEADARMDRLGYDRVVQGEGYGLFTCAHWDEGSRQCGIYADRPDMCRKYPYDEACERGCGYALSPDDRLAFGYDKPDEEPNMVWVRDEGEDGWRAAFASTPDFIWDEARGILRRAS
jgi:Fe-S-cluster containining protein